MDNSDSLEKGLLRDEAKKRETLCATWLTYLVVLVTSVIVVRVLSVLADRQYAIAADIAQLRERGNVLEAEISRLRGGQRSLEAQSLLRENDINVVNKWVRCLTDHAVDDEACIKLRVTHYEIEEDLFSSSS
jgi:hypothetical protein